MLGRLLLRLLRLHFSLADNRVDLLFGETSHLHQGVGLDHREVAVGEEPLADQLLGQLAVDAFQLAEPSHGVFDLLVKLLAGHDLDVPDAELAGQADVLSPPANGQRKLVLADQHDRPAQHLAKDHLLDFGRLERIGDQHLHVVAPANDVDLLAQLLHDVLDPVASDPHARPHAVHPLVRAGDGHLAAASRFAGDGLDLDHAVGDFGDFLLKEPLEKMGPRAAEHDLHPASDFAHVADRCPDPLVRMVRLAGDLFASWEDGLGVR